MHLINIIIIQLEISLLHILFPAGAELVTSKWLWQLDTDRDSIDVIYDAEITFFTVGLIKDVLWIVQLAF